MQVVDPQAAQTNVTLDRMVGSMRQISDSSAQTSKITQLIEGFAFQTDILAQRNAQAGRRMTKVSYRRELVGSAA